MILSEASGPPASTDTSTQAAAAAAASSTAPTTDDIPNHGRQEPNTERPTSVSDRNDNDSNRVTDMSLQLPPPTPLPQGTQRRRPRTPTPAPQINRMPTAGSIHQATANVHMHRRQSGPPVIDTQGYKLVQSKRYSKSIK